MAKLTLEELKLSLPDGVRKTVTDEVLAGVSLAIIFRFPIYTLA